MQGRQAWRGTLAIDRVAKHRTAQGGAVNADLMGPTGAGAALQPAQAVMFTEQAIVGARRLTCGIRLHPPAALLRALAQRELDGSLRLGRSAVDDRPVDLLDLTALE